MDFRQLRETEFSRLDELHEIYLDYTGSGLYSKWQVDQHMRLLEESILGNPHSHSPSSMASTELVEGARRRILEHFKAAEKDYSVIFTHNATHALKLVGESFPFNGNSRYVLTSDNHNSVNGIREYARIKGSAVSYIPISDRMDTDYIRDQLTETDGVNLFAYPAQSNFSGTRYPLEWIDYAHSMGYYVLLDAAAFVPTNELDLSRYEADFVPVSFYKMFGYPTGVGALIIKNETMDLLSRKWFSGGTVDLVTTKYISHHLLDGPRGFEDGTPNFLDIAAITTGLDFIQKVGINNIHSHVVGLAEYLGRSLERIEHSNGKKLVVIYRNGMANIMSSAIAMNVKTPTGRIVDPRIVGKIATENNISIRTGCFCNPGAGEHFFGYTAENEKTCMEKFLKGRLKLQEFPECAGGTTGGAVRISLGIASNEKDIDSFVSLLNTFRDCEDSINDQELETSFSC